MFCHNCGSELPDVARFCAYCGVTQTDSAPASPENNPPRSQSSDGFLPKLKAFAASAADKAKELFGKAKDFVCGLSKKQLIIFGSVALAVIIAIIILFSALCSGCGGAAHGIVEKYLKAVEKEDTAAVTELYLPEYIEQCAEETGFAPEDIVTRIDTVYYIFGGDDQLDVDVKQYNPSQYADMMLGYFPDMTDDEKKAAKEELLSGMEGFADSFRTYYEADISDYSFAVAEVDFEGSEDQLIAVFLVRSNGKWYIANTNYGEMGLDF